MTKVLLTGANGFVATHVLQRLFDLGYDVTGTVRSEGKIADVLEAGPQFKNRVKFEVIEDISASHAWDSIFQATAFDYVVHVAAAVPYEKSDDLQEAFIKPGVNGNLSLLESAQKYGKNIKHITFTGAISAIMDPEDTFHVKKGPDDWSTRTIEQALQTKSKFDYYRVSKLLAEKAVWEYVASAKPHFSVSAMVATLIVGPSMHKVTTMSRMDLASTLIYPLFNGSTATVPETPFSAYIDVRDLAIAHTEGLTNPGAANQLFLIGTGHLSYKRIVDLLRERMPELGDHVAKDGAGHPLEPLLDDSKTKELLHFQQRPFEDTILDTVNQILEIEKSIGGK